MQRPDQPTASQIREILTLAGAADDADGVAPLSESVLLGLADQAATTAAHLIVRDSDDTLAGYAHLEQADDAGESALELVVHPRSRRRGIGRALVAAATSPDDGALDTPDGALDTPDGGTLLVWAHGDHPSAAALALELGFERARELWQLRRPLPEPTDGPALPVGISLRAFRPGEDDEAWLALNRRAFADHPEQGRWTAADLRVRMAEPWFDPAGFLLAVEDTTGRPLGFHWTKVHEQPAGGPIGEVYVLGVDPATHGLGLGRALTNAGLRHLHGRGLRRVMLYVDAANEAAVALYTRLGFARWCTHVQYRRPSLG